MKAINLFGWVISISKQTSLDKIEVKQPEIILNNEPEYDEYARCSGRSTRLIDKYVQDLFINGEVTVKDHFDSRRAHEEIFRTLIGRLQVEHKIQRKDVNVNFAKHSIKLLR